MNSNTPLNLWYYATKDEALKWPIGPGNMITFKDPDGKHFYEKSLGWSPYEGVKFKEFVYQEEAPIAPQSVTSYEPPVEAVQPKLDDSEIAYLKNDISELKAQIAELVKMQQNKQFYKKGDNK